MTGLTSGFARPDSGGDGDRRDPGGRRGISRFAGSTDALAVELPFESNQWRAWFNPHINVYRHGVMLEELSTLQRNAFLDLLRVTMSSRGYAQARDIMRLNPVDNLAQAGAFRDNAVIPYCGIRADGFSDPRRARLTDAILANVGCAGDGYAAVTMDEVARHLDETWFAWMGGTGRTDPFYYRLHSPVVLIEFEHLPGVAFDNPEPSRHHIHTVIRTPNGGDYGADLLAEHHERFDHQVPPQS